MAFWGICFQIIILKPIENFFYSKFQITYRIISVDHIRKEWCHQHNLQCQKWC